MYRILYSCYSAACWPISCLICRGRQTSSSSPEAIITPSDIDSPEDFESKYFSTAFDDQKSHGSCVTENTLPKIFINNNIDGDEKTDVGSLLVTCQYSAQKKLVSFV